MAATQAVSFDDIIKSSRQKKKNEELANQILGKNRRASAPGSGPGKAQNATPGGSLASRIGVTKRSASVNLSSKSGSRASSAAAGRNTTSAKPTRRYRPDENRLVSAINSANGQATVRNAGGINIKGASSAPPVVIGSNFAPGTTAADIESAIEPVSGKIISCWITSQKPTVTAEITFAETSSAEKAVANFHNQRADGRILSFQLSHRDAFGRLITTGSPFDDQREQADRNRRAQRTADPAVQDGRYGFNEQVQQPLDSRGSRYNGRGNNRRGNRGRRNFNGGGQGENQGVQKTGLYSDEMMTDAPPQGARNKSNRWQ
ncbi:uncharacterized protein BDW70DRAFT_128922 [Aspergillus foveolatus]|uniref:uncharacterized protein n=1 Tax=Aspergillus foveolatus TaxID=210207 RepID=UPI003CCE1E97